MPAAAAAPKLPTIPAIAENGSAKRHVYSNIACTFPTAIFPAIAQRQPIAAQSTYPRSFTSVVIGLIAPAVVSAFLELVFSASFNCENLIFARSW